MDHGTKEVLAGAPLPEGPLSTHQPPHEATFQLSPAELKQIQPTVIKRRTRLKGSWSSLFREKLSHITPYTTWNFSDSSYSDPSSREQNACLFIAKGYCAEKYCDAKITVRAEKLNQLTVQVNISGPCTHVNAHTFGELRGLHRKDCSKGMAYGRKPVVLRNQILGEMDSSLFASGVRIHSGSSLKIMQNVSKEEHESHQQDSDIDVSLRKLANQSAATDKQDAEESGMLAKRKLFGFFRVLQTLPRTVIAFNEAQVRAYHDLAGKPGVLTRWDATGSLIRSEVCGGEAKQVLWYALVVSHPPEIRPHLKYSSSTLLVAEMATCDLSIESAILLLRTLRHEERELFKSNVLPQIMSDRSAVLILAALQVYNSESLADFNKRAIRIATGTGTEADMEKMNPCLCESHSIKCVSRKAKEVGKAWQVEFATYCFVGLSRQQHLKQLQQLFEHISVVMCTRLSTAQVEKAFSAIRQVTESLDADILNATKDESKHGDTSWELSSYSEHLSDIDALFEVPSTPAPSSVEGLSPNRYYMPTWYQYLKIQWMTCFGLWTRVLRKNVERRKGSLPIPRSMTDGEVEQVFNVEKNYYFPQKKQMRMDHFFEIHAQTIKGRLRAFVEEARKVDAFKNTKRVIASRVMTQQQLQRLLQSLNVPEESQQANELSESLEEAGLSLPRETWAKRSKPGPKRPTLLGKYSHPPKRPFDLPALTYKAKRPKKEESLLDSDRAVHQSAMKCSCKGKCTHRTCVCARSQLPCHRGCSCSATKCSNQHEQFKEEHSTNVVPSTTPTRKQPKGLANPRGENVCYLNATLQCLVACGLHDVLANTQQDDRPLTTALHVITRAITNADSASALTALYHMPQVCTIRGILTAFNNRQQHDPHEFLSSLVSALGDEVPQSAGVTTVQSLLEGVSTTVSECLRCHQSSPGDMSVFRNIPTPCGRSNTTVQAAVSLELDSEMVLSTQSGWEWCNCQLKQPIGGERKREITEWPVILTVIIKRWETTTHIKLETPVFPSLALSLQNTGGYDLKAFLCHVGSSTDTGHYYAIIEGADKRWYKCDDTKVTFVKNTFSQEQQKSVYLAFYKRHDSTPSIPKQGSCPPLSHEEVWRISTAQIMEVEQFLSSPSVEWTTTAGIISVLHLRSLRFPCWLLDPVINVFMSSVALESSAKLGIRVFAILSFVTTAVMASDDPAQVKHHTKVNFNDVDIVIAPVHLGAHWAVAIADMGTHHISYLDSLGGFNITLIQKLAKYLGRGQHCGAIPWSSSGVQAERDKEGRQEIPMQTNSVDCGAFACMYAYYKVNKMKYDFTQGDMKTIRMWIARRIIALSALLSDQMATNPIQVGGSDDHTATNPIVIESDDSETESHNTPSPSCNAEETLANPEGAVLRWGQHEITWGHLLKVSGQDEHSEAEIPETVITFFLRVLLQITVQNKPQQRIMLTSTMFYDALLDAQEEEEITRLADTYAQDAPEADLILLPVKIQIGHTHWVLCGDDYTSYDRVLVLLTHERKVVTYDPENYHMLNILPTIRKYIRVLGRSLQGCPSEWWQWDYSHCSVALPECTSGTCGLLFCKLVDCLVKEQPPLLQESTPYLLRQWILYQLQNSHLYIPEIELNPFFTSEKQFALTHTTTTGAFYNEYTFEEIKAELQTLQPIITDIICGREPSQLHNMFFSPSVKTKQELREQTFLGPMATFTMDQKQEIIRTLNKLVHINADQLPHRCVVAAYTMDVLIKEAMVRVIMRRKQIGWMKAFQEIQQPPKKIPMFVIST